MGRGKRHHVESSSKDSSDSISEKDPSASESSEEEETRSIEEKEEEEEILGDMEIIENVVIEEEHDEEPEETIKPATKKRKNTKPTRNKKKLPQSTSVSSEGEIEAPQQPKQRVLKAKKGPSERTETLHCVDVVTYPSPSGIDIACLVMISKSKAQMKIYCIRLDETSRHMTSPFYEHKMILHAECDVMLKPSERRLVYYTGADIFNVHRWLGTAYRLGPDPQQMRYVPTTNGKISTILRETFFFHYVTIHSNSDIDHDNGNNNENSIPLDDTMGNDNDDSDESYARDVSPASSTVKNEERARIMNLLLPDHELKRNSHDEERGGPAVLQNNPVSIRWHDTPGAAKRLDAYLHKFKVLVDVAKEERKLFSDHTKFWATIDNVPEKTIEVTDHFYTQLRPHTSYTEATSELYLTAEHIRRFIDSYQPFFPIRVFLCNNLDTMQDLFYIHHHLHTHTRPDTLISLPFESYNYNDMNDMAQLMQHIERIFAHNLPLTIVNTANATTGCGGATMSLSSLSTTEIKYHDQKKVMANANGHMQQMVDAYGIKFSVKDTMIHRIIKMSIIQHIVVPYIVSEIDQKAKSDYAFNRSTCRIVTLFHVINLFACLFGINNIDNADFDENDIEYQKSLSLIVHTIKVRENVQFKGDTSYIDLYNAVDGHRYTLEFVLGDMCQIMELLYREGDSSVITRATQSLRWRPVFESIHRITSDANINAKKITLFSIPIADIHTTQYEGENNTLTRELIVDEVQVFNEIDSLIVPRVTTIGITQQRINVAISTAADMLAFKDAKLIQQVVRDQPNNTLVIVSANSCYTRGMLPRFFTLQAKMPHFFGQYCVTVDQLMLDLSLRKKTYIVIPYLHLLSPKEMNQILTWLSGNDGVITAKRVFITGCVDILAATPGQVFIDLLRCIDYNRYNQLIWQLDRPCDSFNTVINNHWRMIELSERSPEMVIRFMQSFHRMTTTVCHGIKDLWYVKDYPTLAFFIACIVNRVNQHASPLGGNNLPVVDGVQNIRRSATARQMPDYTFASFKSLGVNVYNRYGRSYKSINILKESMKKEIKSCTMNEVNVSYNDPTTPLDTIQLDRYLTGYSLGYDEIKHINRHIYVIAMADVLKLSRNELHILFCMANNLFIVDNPFTPHNNTISLPTQPHNYILKSSSSSLSSSTTSPPPFQWHSSPPNEAKERITDYFATLTKFATCRYTHESYIHDVNASPMLNGRTYPVIMMDEDEVTTKRKRDDKEDDMADPIEEAPKKKKKKKSTQK